MADTRLSPSTFMQIRRHVTLGRAAEDGVIYGVLPESCVRQALRAAGEPETWADRAGMVLLDLQRRLTAPNAGDQADQYTQAVARGLETEWEPADIRFGRLYARPMASLADRIDQVSPPWVHVYHTSSLPHAADPVMRDTMLTGWKGVVSVVNERSCTGASLVMAPHPILPLSGPVLSILHAKVACDLLDDGAIRIGEIPDPSNRMVFADPQLMARAGTLHWDTFMNRVALRVLEPLLDDGAPMVNRVTCPDISTTNPAARGLASLFAGDQANKTSRDQAASVPGSTQETVFTDTLCTLGFDRQAELVTFHTLPYGLRASMPGLSVTSTRLQTASGCWQTMLHVSRHTGPSPQDDDPFLRNGYWQGAHAMLDDDQAEPGQDGPVLDHVAELMASAAATVMAGPVPGGMQTLMAALTTAA